jgi:hypothetical protein
MLKKALFIKKRSVLSALVASIGFSFCIQIRYSFIFKQLISCLKYNKCCHGEAFSNKNKKEKAVAIFNFVSTGI